MNTEFKLEELIDQKQKLEETINSRINYIIGEQTKTIEEWLEIYPQFKGSVYIINFLIYLEDRWVREYLFEGTKRKVEADFDLYYNKYKKTNVHSVVFVDDNKQKHIDFYLPINKETTWRTRSVDHKLNCSVSTNQQKEPILNIFESFSHMAGGGSTDSAYNSIKIEYNLNTEKVISIYKTNDD